MLSQQCHKIWRYSCNPDLYPLCLYLGCLLCSLQSCEDATASSPAWYNDLAAVQRNVLRLRKEKRFIALNSSFRTTLTFLISETSRWWVTRCVTGPTDTPCGLASIPEPSRWVCHIQDSHAVTAFSPASCLLFWTGWVQCDGSVHLVHLGWIPCQKVAYVCLSRSSVSQSRWTWRMFTGGSCTCWKTTPGRTRTSMATRTTLCWWRRWPAFLLYVLIGSSNKSFVFSLNSIYLLCYLFFRTWVCGQEWGSSSITTQQDWRQTQGRCDKR